MNDSSSYTEDGDIADQSICPAGWKLPTYEGARSYDNLVTILSLKSGENGNMHHDPVYFTYGGIWAGQSGYVGYSGAYWSSVANDDNNSYALVLVADGDSYEPIGGRRYGISVRCVAR